jgi:voltage-gated potassium channel
VAPSIPPNLPSGPLRGARWEVHRIIFEADTPAGKLFDVLLISVIVASVGAVCLESVTAIRAEHGALLRAVEWTFTALFTVEYVLRLWSVRQPLRYATSFFGLVDLLAILPTYLSVFLPGTQSLLVIRALRLLRIFRVFKLASFVIEADVLVSALRSSARKVGVFVGTVLILVLILGAAMYLIEGEDSGFTSIPRSMYWAVVTMTTVGYGDITPQSVPGQLLAAATMILGYGIIAVPTGIVTAQLVHDVRSVTTRTCPTCVSEGHEWSARFCRDCGAPLRETGGEP